MNRSQGRRAWLTQTNTFQKQVDLVCASSPGGKENQGFTYLKTTYVNDCISSAKEQEKDHVTNSIFIQAARNVKKKTTFFFCRLTSCAGSKG